jgi:hypothetical protein
MAKYYVMAIGGSGALAGESLVHLCAAGFMGNDEIDFIIVDPDQTNENVQRLQQTILNYRKVRSSMNQKHSILFTPEMKYNPGNFWNPNAGEESNLENGISYVHLNREDNIKYRLLTNLLFSEDKRKEKLDKGYKGNPMIGTIFMKDIEEAEFFKEMAAEENLNLFVFGSLFGGTGASGIPVMGKSLKDMRQEKGKGSYIGACITLPYFSIKQPKEMQETDFKKYNVNLLPDSHNFLPAVKFAIPYYINKAKNKENGYDAIYFIGCPDSFETSQRDFAIGGKEQKNKSHYVNLFAASAFLDYVAKRSDNAGAKDTQFFATSVNCDGTCLTLNNLPNILNEDNERRLEVFYVLAIYYLKYFLTTGRNESSAMTWFYHDKKGLALKNDFFNTRFIEDLRIYLEKYLRWLGQLQTNSIGLEMFNTKYYNSDADAINLSYYEEELIGRYYLNRPNPKKGFLSAPVRMETLNTYMNNAVDNIEKTDYYQKFLDTLHLGSEHFINKHYLKK